jgi:predicted nuclease of predicted toxin-antitoxin system
LGFRPRERIRYRIEGFGLRDYSAAFGFPPHAILVQMGNCTTADVEALLRTNEFTIRQMVESDLSGLLALY